MADLAALGPRTFDGRPLAGDKIVKMVFVDEAGISNPRHEPIITVGGVIVKAEAQWKALEVRLAALANKYAPPEMSLDDFAFHATDLFSAGKFFTKDKYPRQVRWDILLELCKLPAEFGLHVAVGYELRANHSDWNGTAGWIWACARAFHTVLMVTEDHMRKNTEKDDVAGIIAEDNGQTRNLMRFVCQHSQKRDAYPELHADQRDRVWLTRIMGEPSFQQKSYRSPLQLADISAFVAKRHLMGRPDIHDFWETLKPQIVNKVSAEFL